MKKDHGVGYVKKSLIFFLFLLTALILAGVGQAATITQCNQCHGMPPLDNTTRNAVTGAFQGNHQTHLPASAVAANCVKCHQNASNNVLTYDVKHAPTNGYKIQIANNVNTSPATGQYNVSGSPITFKNQTTVPVLGSCSTVNCHFENLTDVWGVPAASTYSTLGATAATCAKCHGAPPAGTSPSFTGGVAGSHAKHDTYFKGIAQCIKCHSDHTAEASKFAHATSAGRRNLVVQLRDPSNASSGSYTGAPLNDYLPSQATVFGTCNTSYCHSNGLAVPSYTAPVWGNAATGACGTCHGANATTVPASTPHAKHVGSTAVYRYSCAKCHAATVKDTVDSTVFAAISSYNLHVNKSRDVNFNAYNPGASYNGTNCNNAYCHSIGNTNVATSKLPPTYGGSLYNTPTWSGSVSCNSCHGRSNAQGFPDYTSASAGSSTANSHYRHVVFKSVGCVECHYKTTKNGTSIRSDIIPSLHVNATTDDVFFNLSSNNKSGTYAKGVTFKTCSNTYCHSNGNSGPAVKLAQWGDKMPTDCTGCHGNDYLSASPIVTGKHRAHLNNYTTLGRSNYFNCVDCHAKTVSGNRTIANQANHVNSFKDYSGVKAGKVATVNSGKCNNVYCHSTGQKAAVATFWNMTASNWYSTRTLDCNGCHGNATPADFAPVAGAPNYVNGGATTPTANSHNKHVPGAGIVNSTGCAKCHYRTVDAAIANKLRNYSTLHLNGTRNVNFSVSASLSGVQGRYSSTTQQCMNTYCHGAPKTPSWGSASLLCNQCHSADSTGFGTVAGSSTTGAHGAHYQVATPPASGTYASMPPGQGSAATATLYQFNCTSCHTSPATHANGIADVISGAAGQVYFGYSTTGKSGTYKYAATAQGTTDNGFKWTAGKCSTTYCHSNGNGAFGNNTSFTWNTAQGTLGCTGCHGGNAGAGTLAIATAKHGVHMNNAALIGTNFACAECHAKTVSLASDTLITNKLNHVNKFKDFSGVRAAKSIYTGPSANCNATYCHSNGKGTAGNAITWNQAAVWATKCNQCHGTTNGYGAPDYASGAAGSVTANSHGKHATSATDCNKCHRLIAQAAGNLIVSGSTSHLNSAVDVQFAQLAFTNATGHYNYGPRSCSNTYCHGSTGTPVWGTTGPLPCDSCHKASNALPAGHTIHFDNATVFNTYTATVGNRSSATNYTFVCSDCHTRTMSNHAAGAVSSTQAAQILFGYSTAGRSPSYTWAGGTNLTDPQGFNYTSGTAAGCNATYCHSNGNGANGNNTTYTWATAKGTIRCTGCHGGNASSASPIATGKHADHINPNTAGLLLGTGNGFGCVQCHAKTVFGNDTTVSNKAMHVNKFKDYSGVYAGSSARYSTASKSCSTIYCHSNGNPGAIVFVSMTGSKIWATGGLTNIGCNGCHGRSNPTTGAPDYANGYPGNPNAANSHPKHITALGINDTTGCAKCHAKTVNAGVASKFRSYSTLHLNGTPNVIMQPAYGGTFSANVCSNVSCHSNGKGTYLNPTWGQTDNCGFCHAINKLSKGHIFHIYTSAVPTVYINYTANRSTSSPNRYNFGCSNCHPTANTNHMAGTVVVSFAPTEPSAGTLKTKNSASISYVANGVVAGAANSGTYKSGSVVKCWNIYCHSNGMSGANFRAYTTPDWYLGNFTGDRCAACHGNSPNNGGKLGSASHSAHVVSIHNDGISSGATGLIAPAGIVGVIAGHGDPAQATTINCNVCHNATVTSSANDNSTACISCHTTPFQYGAVSHGAAAIANKANHVNGKVDIAFQAGTVISKAQLRQSTFTNTTTVFNAWTRNGSTNYKTGTTNAFDTSRLTSGWTTGGTCSTASCHNGRQVNWYTNAGQAAQCVICHTNL